LQKVIYILILIVSIYGCSASRKAEKTVIKNEVSVKLIEEVIQKRNLTNLNFIIQRADIELNNDGTIIKLRNEWKISHKRKIKERNRSSEDNYNKRYDTG
jgi:hypothetical protein